MNRSQFSEDDLFEALWIDFLERLQKLGSEPRPNSYIRFLEDLKRRIVGS